MKEKDIRAHIKRVKSNYGEHVEILTAIFDAKVKDFIKRGATPEQAIDCVNEWIGYELT